MRILVINGPNLNLLGKREPGVYGSLTLEAIIEGVKAQFPDIVLTDYQSNVEGELINALQDADSQVDGVVFNAGGYTHTSVAIRDAISAISIPVVEVHMSNTAAREDFRHASIIAGVCVATVAGFGADSYRLAVDGLRNYLTNH